MIDTKITALTANTTPATTDLLPIVDDPAGTPATQKITLADFLKVINSLTANTTPAVSDVLALIDDPSGTPAAQKITIENFLKVVNGLTADGTPDTAADYLLAYDASAGAAKKVLMNLVGSSTGGVTSGPQSFGDNYVITPSVASNNLTVALKTVAGADPSSSDKITVRIGNTKREITAAISTTKNAGTNWCNAGSAELAAQDVDYFVYAIQETGGSAGTKIGFSRMSYAVTMGDFVNTSTSEKYIAGNWTNFNSTDQVEVIGRFRARLSAGAGYTWSIPTALVINRPIYETDELTWTPTHSRAGTNYTNLPTVNSAKYQVVGKRMTFNEFHTQNATPGGTNFQRMTLPFTNPLAYNQGCFGANGANGTMLGFYWQGSQNYGDFILYNATAEATGTAGYFCTGTFFIA